MKSPIRCLLLFIIAFNYLPPAWSAANADPYRAMGVPRPDHAVQAPDFSLPALDGTQTSLGDYRGQVVLLNFWATWCAPCRKEMPSIQRLWERYKSKDFVVLAVSEDDGETQQVSDFIRKVKVYFPVLLDHDFKIADSYVLPGLPTSYLIGRDGTIAATVVGTQDWSRPEARALLEHLLKLH